MARSIRAAGDDAPAAFMPSSDPANFLAFFGSAGALTSSSRCGLIELRTPVVDTSLLADFAPSADATVPLAGVTTIVVDS